MTELADQMSEIAEVNLRTSADAQGAADAMGSQRLTMQDLNTVATQLAGLAERLAESVDRFTVRGRDQSTLEFEADRAAAELADQMEAEEEAEETSD